MVFTEVAQSLTDFVCPYLPGESFKLESPYGDELPDKVRLFCKNNKLRVRSIDRIPEEEYMEQKLEILRFYGDSH